MDDTAVPRRAVRIPPTSGVHVSDNTNTKKISLAFLTRLVPGFSSGSSGRLAYYALFRLNEPMRMENWTLSEPSSLLSDVLSGPRR